MNFDLTPDPKVLIALTHTPMKPIDALCELIDNAIDSFEASKLLGMPVTSPLIIIKLPRPSELDRNDGRIIIMDNGPGLTAEFAEKSLKAGFSGNNPYDCLGLFGMGFNISTGKFGRVTRFFTARLDEEKAIEVEIDLEKMRQAKSFSVPVNLVDKPQGIKQGTIVEIKEWWPLGNANSGFVRKLIQYGMNTIRSEIGRIYATVLRNQNIRIVINDEECVPFEHCVWSETRFVEHERRGQIPAIIRFDKAIGTQKRCGNCTALIPPDLNSCPACKSSSQRTIEERIKGWVGIQRFDDDANYGIDLIRNGRAIRVGEKNAFFTYVDELKKEIKDYPNDQQYGRIVGEIHINHVPVDFLKQDFQRSSPEWQHAMSFIRGDSSLQPEQPNADQNRSPIFMLYQGYRKVRVFGKKHMYMGYWNPEKNKAERISRVIEKEYYQKFLEKEPGFYDDAEWWKLVENADQRPIPVIIECPGCNNQMLPDTEVCTICGYILKSKICITPDCGEELPFSAQSCPKCGNSQVPKIDEPWTCMVCGSKNTALREICNSCSNPKGTENTLSREYLISHSNKCDELSISGCSVDLADGTYSSAINVDTYITQGPIIPNQGTQTLPLVIFKSVNIEIFLDRAHQLFTTLRVHPEQLIASEIAMYIYDYNNRLAGQQHASHTLSFLEWSILNKYWAEVLEDSPAQVRNDIIQFFDVLKNRLKDILEHTSIDIYNELLDEQKKKMVENMISQSEDISKIGEMASNGKYLRFIDEKSVVKIFEKHPDKFFDGRFWEVGYNVADVLPENVIEDVRQHLKAKYMNCMEDVSDFLKYRSPESLITQRARMSLEYLLQKVV